MPVKDEYEREFVFDIDAYLCDAYGGMSLSHRRAICALFIRHFDVSAIEEHVDQWVANQAMIKQGYVTLEQLTEEDENNE